MFLGSCAHVVAQSNLPALQKRITWKTHWHTRGSASCHFTYGIYSTPRRLWQAQHFASSLPRCLWQTGAETAAQHVLRYSRLPGRSQQVHLWQWQGIKVPKLPTQPFHHPKQLVCREDMRHASRHPGRLFHPRLLSPRSTSLGTPLCTLRPGEHRNCPEGTPSTWPQTRTSLRMEGDARMLEAEGRGARGPTSMPKPLPRPDFSCTSHWR